MSMSSSESGRSLTDHNEEMNMFIPFFFRVSDETERTEPANDDNDVDDTLLETATDWDSSRVPGEIRVVLVNPFDRTYIVVEGLSSFDALFWGSDSISKPEQPPASKASIETMPEMEIGDDAEYLECAICLDGMTAAKEMPCKHRFHGGCVERWLRIHGSCPVCRFQMPAEEQNHKKFI
ncbi:hypothetical protein QQ045_032137 [Rhodiola kirilowii]